MKKIVILLFLFFQFNNILYAALSEIDSLKNRLQLQNQADTLRIDLLVDIANLLEKDNPEKEQYLKEAISLAQKTNDKRRLVIPILNLTRHYLNDGQFNLAYEQALYSIDVSKKIENPTFLIEGYNNLALIYTNQDKNDDALKVYLEGYNFIKDKKPSLDKAIITYNIGFAYYQMQNYNEAEIWYKKVEEICEAISLDFGLLRAYGALLTLYGKTGEFDKGDKYEQKVRSLIENINDDRSKASVYNNLAIYASDKGDFKQTIVYGKKAEKLYQDLNMKSELISVHDKMFKAFKADKEYKNALEYAEKKMGLVDSIYTEEQLKTITELEKKYETKKLKQAKEFETIRAEKNKRLFILSIIAGFLILLTAAFIIYQIQLKKRAELAEVKLADIEEKLQLERKLSSAEMKALRAQMNPHFLFNAFNAIQEYIIMNNRELASDYLGKFADLMRIYLDHSSEKKITLENEIEATELYLELEKVRFEHQLDYKIEVAENIDESLIEIPPMLIQPFVENSLKHGLLHKKDNRKLYVRFLLNDNVLTCIIEDNGIGRKKSALLNKMKLKKHKSFATSATKNRIDLLNIGRERPIKMQIIDLKDEKDQPIGTKVQLSIPI